jgi:hypothetical protein
MQPRLRVGCAPDRLQGAVCQAMDSGRVGCIIHP